MTDNIKLLLVDDEKRFQETTRKVLAKKGFHILLADSGEDAVNKIAQNPHVVVLDIKMPGMDGHKVLKEIKKVRPSLPVTCPNPVIWIFWWKRSGKPLAPKTNLLQMRHW